MMSAFEEIRNTQKTNKNLKLSACTCPLCLFLCKGLHSNDAGLFKVALCSTTHNHQKNQNVQIDFFIQIMVAKIYFQCVRITHAHS